ncbi:hypothetical protein D3C75_524040 [compost metagenome]
MKNTPYTSIVEILVCVKCMKSSANNPAARAAYLLFLNKRSAITYMRGNMATPNKVPIIRQPNGLTPNSSIPMAINNLPSGGCVFS